MDQYKEEEICQEETYQYIKNANLNYLPPQFGKTADLIQNYFKRENIRTDKNNHIYLRKCFDKEECPKIDYNTHAKTFASEFFLENYWKACHVFFKQSPHPVHKIMEVGVGSGAAILAFLSYLELTQLGEKWDLELTLIDKSKAQIVMAKKILNNAKFLFKSLRIRANFICKDFKVFNTKESNADIIIFSHVLTESRPDVEIFLDKAQKILNFNGEIYIIERGQDNIWEVIEDKLKRFSYSFLTQNEGYIKLEKSFKTRKQHIIPLFTSFRYLVLHPENTNMKRQMLDRYFEAWEKKSIDLLDEVFTEDAEYYDKPLKLPLRGLEEIKNYWREKVLIQKNISTRILNIAYSSNKILAEWEAEFSRFDEKINIVGMMILSIDLKKRRISRLNEYYTTRKTKL